MVDTFQIVNALTDYSELILETVVEIGKSPIGVGLTINQISTIIDDVRKKNRMTEDETKSIYWIIKCIEDALNNTFNSMDSKISNKEKEELRWNCVHTFFLFCHNNSDNIGKLSYIPNFRPIVEARNIIEQELLKKYDIECCDNFIRIFNENLLKQKIIEYEYEFNNEVKKDIDEYLLKVSKFQENLIEGTNKIVKHVYIDQNAKKINELGTSWSSNVNEYPNDLEKSSNILAQFLKSQPSNWKKNILFIGADFGIGKTTFLKYEATRFANNYIKRKDGFIPVYIDMRSYSNRDIENLRNELLGIGVLEKNGPPIMLILDSFDAMMLDNSEKHFIHIMDLIEKLIYMGDNRLPYGSKIVIASRFTFGPYGHIAKYIQNDFALGYFVKLFGLCKKQIDEWAEEHTNNIFNKQYLIDCGLNINDCRKPSFLWMLLKNFNTNINYKKNNLGSMKTEVYLDYINSFFKNGKKTSFDEDCMRENSEVRSLLQKLSVLNVEKTSDLNMSTILTDKNIKLLNQYQGELYSFNRSQLKFADQTINDYFSAEFLLNIFIFFSKNKDISKHKPYLCIGEINEVNISFLFDLVKIIIRSSKNKQTSIVPFLNTPLFDDSAYILKSNIFTDMSDAETIFHDFFNTTLEIMSTKEPLLVDNDVISGQLNEHQMTYYILSKNISDYSLFRERWIAFIIICAFMSEELYYDYRNKIVDCFKKLLLDSLTIPEWVKRHLYSFNLFNEIDFSNKELKESVFKNTDLNEANFENSDLRNADFSNASIKKSNFKGANLEGAKFYYADLEYSIFDGANLTEANFVEANITKTSFIKANLEHAIIDYTKMEETDFRDAYLVDSVFDRSVLNKTEFEDLVNTLKEIQHDENSEISFINNSNFTGANFRNATMNEQQKLYAKSVGGFNVPD